MTQNELIERIQSLQTKNKHPIIVAISGFGGSGKSTLAKEISRNLKNAAVVSMDDFIVDRLSKRSQNWDSFDRVRLIRQVLDPALKGEQIKYQKYYWKSNALKTWRNLGTVEHLIIEGCSAIHPDLSKFHDLAVWIDSPLEVAAERGISRDRSLGSDNDELWHKIWIPNDRAYFKKFRPDKLADIIVESS